MWTHRHCVMNTTVPVNPLYTESRPALFRRVCRHVNAIVWSRTSASLCAGRGERSARPDVSGQAHTEGLESSQIMDKPKVTIYTDGGADPNPGPGGWGAVLLFERSGVIHRKELKGGATETTNNRMELTAALEALKALKQGCEVEMYTDSQYVQRGITEWMAKWKKTNFKKGTIQNVDLWQLLDAEASRHDIHWRWVKGHAANEDNERADILAGVGRAEALGSPVSEVVPEIPYRIYLSVPDSRSRSGSWAALVETGDEQRVVSGKEASIVGNRLHLLAAVAALEAIPEKEGVHLFTGSDYLRNGIAGWIKGWKQNGWRTREGSEVKHRDLWERLDALAQIHKLKLSSIDASHPKMEILAAALLAAGTKTEQE